MNFTPFKNTCLNSDFNRHIALRFNLFFHNYTERYLNKQQQNYPVYERDKPKRSNILRRCYPVLVVLV